MRIAGIDPLRRFRTNQFRALLAIGFGDQLFDRHFGKIHIGVKLGSVFKCQLLRFDQRMQTFRAIKSHAFEIEVFQDLQHL